MRYIIEYMALLLFTIIIVAVTLHFSDKIDSFTIPPDYKPPDKVMAYKPIEQPSRGGRILQMEATAYTWTGNRTATGTWPEEGRTVAVDPTIIPYGTELVVNGKDGYIAEDTGGDIKGHRLDIYMNSLGQARYWGRQTVRVEILRSDD